MHATFYGLWSALAAYVALTPAIHAAEPAAAKLVGRVTDDDGRPIQGTVVRVQLGLSVVAPNEFHESTTDENGNYLIPLPYGQVLCGFPEPPGGFCSDFSILIAPIVLSPREPAHRLDFTFARAIPLTVDLGDKFQSATTVSVEDDIVGKQPGAHMADRVVHSQKINGQRSVESTIRSNGPTGSKNTLWVSNGHGSLSKVILIVPPGFQTDKVLRTVDGMEGNTPTIEATDAGGRVLVIAGAAARIENGRLIVVPDTSLVRPRITFHVRGRVVDAQGRPISGVCASVFHSDARRAAYSDENGDFDLEMQIGRMAKPSVGSPRPMFYLSLAHPEYARVEFIEVLYPYEGDVTLDRVEMQQKNTVRLRVVDESGAPVEGVWVTVGKSGFARSDAAGRVTDHHVPAGETSVHAHFGRLICRQDIVVKPGDAGDEITLTLKPDPRSLEDRFGPNAVFAQPVEP